MNFRDEELKEFKTKINLTHFMSAHGFMFNKRKSTQRHDFMKSGDGVIYLVSVSSKDGHWVFKSPLNPLDNGSIIDFCKKHITRNLGEIRKYLRPWVGKFSEIKGSSGLKSVESREKKVVDYNKIKKEYSEFIAENEFNYLQGRGITKKVLQHPKVIGRIKVDSKNIYNNIIFPHYNSKGVCGYEMKGKGGFSGFCKDGEKSMWVTKPLGNEKSVYLFESVIDALSFMQLKPHLIDVSHFISVGGNPSKECKDLYTNFIKKNEFLRVYACFDNDKAGNDLCGLFLGMTPENVLFKKMLPTLKDWNDDLMKR